MHPQLESHGSQFVSEVHQSGPHRPSAALHATQSKPPTTTDAQAWSIHSGIVVDPVWSRPAALQPQIARFRKQAPAPVLVFTTVYSFVSTCMRRLCRVEATHLSSCAVQSGGPPDHAGPKVPMDAKLSSMCAVSARTACGIAAGEGRDIVHPRL